MFSDGAMTTSAPLGSVMPVFIPASSIVPAYTNSVWSGSEYRTKTSTSAVVTTSLTWKDGMPIRIFATESK